MCAPNLNPRRGWTLIELLVVMAIIGVLVGLLLPAVQRVREAANVASCKNQLKQMGLALLLYHDQQRSFPSGYLFSAGATPAGPPAPRLDRRPPPPIPLIPNSPGWGWATLILPCLEANNLAAQINYQLPVESPSHVNVRTTVLRIYVCPSDAQTGVFAVLTDLNQNLASAATNSYAACFGAGGLLNTQPDDGTGMFFRNSRVEIANITDGTSNTLAVGERASLFTQAPWAGVMTGGTTRITPNAPVYTAITELAPTMALARVGHRALNDPYSEPYDFFSPHPGMAQFLFADGSVHALQAAVDVAVLQALATCAGGEAAGSY